jgi:hypothetical protein
MNVTLRVVTVSVVSGLLVAACVVDYAETLRYDGRDYRTKCRVVRDDLIGAPVDVKTTIHAIDDARTIRTVPIDTAIAVRMTQACNDIAAGTWLLAPSDDLTMREVTSLVQAVR